LSPKGHSRWTASKRLSAEGHLLEDSLQRVDPAGKDAGNCKHLACTLRLSGSVSRRFRKNSLFAGSAGGAHHWALVASLVATAKLNGVELLPEFAVCGQRLEILKQNQGVMKGAVKACAYRRFGLHRESAPAAFRLGAAIKGFFGLIGA
jgi:hypothetical protein